MSKYKVIAPVAGVNKVFEHGETVDESNFGTKHRTIEEMVAQGFIKLIDGTDVPTDKTDELPDEKEKTLTDKTESDGGDTSEEKVEKEQKENPEDKEAQDDVSHETLTIASMTEDLAKRGITVKSKATRAEVLAIYLANK